MRFHMRNLMPPVGRDGTHCLTMVVAPTTGVSG
jgi:hypothetical protein